ncbi:unnamed protein product [Brassicogethes aeneus]|uniref:Polyadenylate-binding protein-interacting protein 1 n=1 Tax=Brassicogethes aeneus TaxID=1431903 RepID=A0A9P0ARI1_BRAAE|nr:unnamed protein product [Brassicogethes aeneus]
MDQKVKLWDRDSSQSMNLRQPNKPSESKKNTVKVEDSVIVNSKLSVDAAEFYPNSHPAPSNNVSSIQSRLNKHKKQPESAIDHIGVESAAHQHQNNDEDSPDMLRLKHIVKTLTNDPGQFDHLFDIFMETLMPYLQDAIFLTDCARLLVNQAINYPNFRYTGARLSYHIEGTSPEFRAALHLLCKKELDSNANKQNILLFVAELYIQLHHLNIYGILLIEAFKMLVSKGGNDNIKCVCQALKLTGFSLDKYDKKAIDEIFGQLQHVKSTVDGSALMLLNSVFNLRNANWGHSNQSESSNSPVEEEAYYVEPQNAHFYNLDGQEFTSEESEFLAAHLNCNDEYLTDTSDPDELFNPEPEMDEEIQAAFKEFVRLSK